MQVTTIGLDIAKNVFQLHGVDAAGRVLIRRKVRRNQLLPLLSTVEPCLIGMEACATAHHWARELTVIGHDVRLMVGRGRPLESQSGQPDSVAARAARACFSAYFFARPFFSRTDVEIPKAGLIKMPATTSSEHPTWAS